MVAVVFLSLNWIALDFAEAEESSENAMKEKGLVTEQEYNALKEHRRMLRPQVFSSEKQPFQAQQSESSSGKKQQKEVWEIGTELSYIKYEEPDVMDETGTMFGIVGSYIYRDNGMFKAEGKWSYGQVDYDGQLQDGTPYTISGIDDYMLEIRGLAGYDFSVLKTITVTPYVGFGYRYLNDDTSIDAAGYERESNYFYSPIGIEAINNLKDGWSLGAKVEFDIFWAGIQKSHISDIAAGLNDIKNDQEDGYGVRGSIKIQKEGDKIDFLIESFLKYWNIGESKTSDITYNGSYIGYGYEPKNNSIEIGGKLAVKF